MGYYRPNPACNCGRCSTRGLMGPAVLITLGVLFLLSNTSEWGFERTWPLLLVVVGGIKVVRYVADGGRHVNPGQYPPPPYGAPYGQGTYAAPPNPETAITVQNEPAPQSSAPALGDGNSEVHNG